MGASADLVSALFVFFSSPVVFRRLRGPAAPLSAAPGAKRTVATAGIIPAAGPRRRLCSLLHPQGVRRVDGGG